MNTEVTTKSESSEMDQIQIPIPQLARQTTSIGKHESAQLEPLPMSIEEEIVLDAYNKELLVCPVLEFHRDHYSGLPYDAIYLTHLVEPIRNRLINMLPFPELMRERDREPEQVNPILELSEKDLDVMPDQNPVFKRMDDVIHYKLNNYYNI